MRRVQNLARRSMAWLMLSMGLFVVAPLVNAQTPVRARIRGIPNPVHIGDITWLIRNAQGHDELFGVFRFRPGWEHLDRHYDFRWFQIVKRVSDNPRPDLPRWFDGNNWNNSPAIPFVDPPRGGWDYQYGGDHVANGGARNMRNRGEGADDSPFYENDGGGRNNGTDWEYWYPGFYDRYRRDPSAPLVHEEGNYSSFFDSPRNPVINASITFQVFLAVVNHGSNFLEFVNQNRAFGKLIGFDWVARFTPQTRIDHPIQINPRDKKVDVNNALRNAGFAGWTTLNDGEFELVPEPASLLALAVGLAGLAYRRRRRAA